MPISPKTKSLRGTSGQGDNKPEEENLQTETVALVLSSQDPPSPVDPSYSKPDVVVVEDCVEKKRNRPVVNIPAPMSQSDLKLARKMSKAIADNLGLSGKSRSVKI